jgi:hypothetical protein
MLLKNVKILGFLSVEFRKTARSAYFCPLDSKNTPKKEACVNQVWRIGVSLACAV